MEFQEFKAFQRIDTGEFLCYSQCTYYFDSLPDINLKYDLVNDLKTITEAEDILDNVGLKEVTIFIVTTN